MVIIHVEMHAHNFHCLDLVMFNNLPWVTLNSDLPPVQVVDTVVNPHQHLSQWHLLLHHQVRSLPQNELVRHLLNLQVHILRLHLLHLVPSH